MKQNEERAIPVREPKEGEAGIPVREVRGNERGVLIKRDNPSGVNWGEIGGTLSNQTDLKNAMDLEASRRASIQTDLNTHKENSQIHTTALEKQTWNNKQDAIEVNPTDSATATASKMKINGTVYNLGTGGGGDAAIFTYDMTLNMTTGVVTINSPNRYTEIVQYYTDHGTFPVITGVIHIQGNPDLIVVCKDIVKANNALLITGYVNSFGGSTVKYDIIEINTTADAQSATYSDASVLTKDNDMLVSAEVVDNTLTIRDSDHNQIKYLPTFALLPDAPNMNMYEMKSALEDDVTTLGFIKSNALEPYQTKVSLDADVTALGYLKTVDWSDITNKPNIPSITANPTGTATETLSKLDINGTIYTIGGSSAVSFASITGSAKDNQSLADELNYLDRRVSDIYTNLNNSKQNKSSLESDVASKGFSKVSANPSTEAAVVMTKIKIGDTTYSFPNSSPTDAIVIHHNFDDPDLPEFYPNPYALLKDSIEQNKCYPTIFLEWGDCQYTLTSVRTGSAHTKFTLEFDKILLVEETLQQVIFDKIRLSCSETELIEDPLGHAGSMTLNSVKANPQTEDPAPPALNLIQVGHRVYSVIPYLHHITIRGLNKTGREDCIIQLSLLSKSDISITDKEALSENLSKIISGDVVDPVNHDLLGNIVITQNMTSLVFNVINNGTITGFTVPMEEIPDSFDDIVTSL